MPQVNQINQSVLQFLFKGKMGIEIEEHRVDQERQSLSQFDHPQQLGNRRHQPYFQTDFSESMEELITAPHHRLVGVTNQLHNLQQLLNEQLQPNEIIWPLSMPPRLQADDVTFLEQTFKREWYQGYRDLLLAKYGPLRHIMCGIHVSYSPDPAIVTWYQEQHHLDNFTTAKNQLLFQITQHLVGFRWLLTYLYGASPLDENQAGPQKPVRSIRASRKGFANLPDVHIEYNTLTGFIQAQADAIKTGQLFAPSEFYGPVRLKGSDDLDTLLDTGIQYLELRVLDDDPFALDGMQLSTLQFVKLLIISGILFPRDWDKEKLQQAANANQQVAVSAPTEPLPAKLHLQAQQLIDQLQSVLDQLPNALEWQAALALVQEQINDPKQTIGDRLVDEIKDNSLMEFGFRQGERFKQMRTQASLQEQFREIAPELIPQYRYLAETGIPFVVDSPTKFTVQPDSEQTMTVTNKTSLTTLQSRYDNHDKG
ncbi:glutamate--cysteine ligase [Fructilactobacillus cliffordii]|uniref:Glutamate--cysteine ligase n=1 Tax=Fructilactobacillus cliffordii TaxID=2940299 RepID=A0A9Q8ZY85_9LACO|nr:glutamate--cysteine ligase [Fructilactobacillus cliffordii]USS89731.1 glutamate--cysteine ligase [Fructilactobacillus cliffordii]